MTGQYNLVLIGIDTLRADHLSCYGYHRNTSPNIDKLAQESMLFKNCFSQSQRTAPAFMSIMSSLYPTFHGVMANISQKGRAWQIQRKAKTLAEIMKDAGYATAAFTEDAMLFPEIGFSKGFDIYSTTPHPLSRPENHPLVKWILSKQSDRFFVFFHTYAPHSPYLPPEPYIDMYDKNYNGAIPRSFEELSKLNTTFYNLMKKLKSDEKEVERLKALYDSSINYVDSFIGFLITFLKAKKLIEKTVVVFTSDHGEEFMEHGGLYHKKFYDEILRVPLMIRLPKSEKSGVTEQIVRSIDIAPTVLDFLQIKIPDMFQGESLLEACEKTLGLIAPAEYAYSSALRTSHYKYIFHAAGKSKNAPETELYNVALDPEEKENMSDVSPQLVERLHFELNEELTKKNLPRPPHTIFYNAGKKTVQRIKNFIN